MTCKKYMFGHSDDQAYISHICWSSSTVPGSQLPNPWNFLSVESDKDVFCYINKVSLEST